MVDSGMGSVDWKIVYSIFESHRSIRKYKDAQIPEEHVELMMKAAQRAPTDATLHLWSSIRVKDKSVRRRISQLIGQDHVYSASEFFIFLVDLYRVGKILELHGVEQLRDDLALLMFAAIDAGLAAENMAIMAEALGYGTCFIGGVQNAVREIIEVLRLPERTYPLFGLTIGIADEEPSPRPRLPLNILFHIDAYRDYSRGELLDAINVMNNITRSRRWVRILARYAGSGGYFEERSRVLREVLRERGFKGV